MSLIKVKRAILLQKHFWKNLRFGLNCAFNIYRSAVSKNLTNVNKKHVAIEKYLKNKLGAVIEKYKKEQNDIVLGEHTQKIPIWIFWYQGREAMPKVVELCYKSVQKYLPKDIAELHFLDKDNVGNYIDIPDCILQKHKDGKISTAALSDIIRYSLLARYGGLWLDATIFVTGDLTPCLNKDLFTLKIFDVNLYPYEPSRAYWNNFVWGAKPNNILFLFARDFLLSYWKKHDCIIDYILPDYVIMIAYKNFERVKEMLDNVEPNLHDGCLMLNEINSPYTQDKWQQILDNTLLHKLTYRWEVKEETLDMQKTIYKHLQQLVQE